MACEPIAMSRARHKSESPTIRLDREGSHIRTDAFLKTPVIAELAMIADGQCWLKRRNSDEDDVAYFGDAHILGGWLVFAMARRTKIRLRSNP